jgi:hypothetical protein
MRFGTLKEDRQVTINNKKIPVIIKETPRNNKRKKPRGAGFFHRLSGHVFRIN